jgi:squalene monooxygenase
MFTHPHRVPGRSDEKPRYAVARLDQYPFLLYKSARVVRFSLTTIILIDFRSLQFYTACVVFGPLVWMEMFAHEGPNRTTLLLGLVASLAIGAVFLS